MAFTSIPMRFVDGDVDRSGVVDLADAIIVNKYLVGNQVVDIRTLTRMDINNNKIIDFEDRRMLLDSTLGWNEGGYVTTTIYSAVPNDVTMMYYKHEFTPGASITDYTTYTFSPPSPNVNTRSMVEETEPVDETNLNVVKFTYPNRATVGTGFIVDEHTIATCWHCVAQYNAQNDTCEFAQGINISVCGSDGQTVLATYTADAVHVPQKYLNQLELDTTLPETEREAFNYDYALIYVEDDLTEYTDPGNIAYMTDEFSNTNANMIATGFTNINNSCKRYFYSGQIEEIATATRGKMKKIL